MTHRAVPTALSFGQQFLFQEAGAKPRNLSGLNKKRVRPKQSAPFLQNLKRVALLGWALGFASSILVQCIWPSAQQPAGKIAKEPQPKTALVAVASHR